MVSSREARYIFNLIDCNASLLKADHTLERTAGRKLHIFFLLAEFAVHPATNLTIRHLNRKIDIKCKVLFSNVYISFLFIV